MPSTDPDRDPKPSGPKGTEENPFIKFKRFADAQIGAVLQGIIGLPSVFSKQPNDAHSRWADIRDDLQRRDRLLAELRASRESESNESFVDEEDEEVEIPVKKFPGWKNTRHSSGGEQAEVPVKKYSGWSLPTFTRSDMGKSSGVDDRTDQVDTIDFFSPISKALFAHIRRSPLDDAADWDERRRMPVPSNTLCVYYACHNGSHSGIGLSEEQWTGTALNMIQSMVFRNISRTIINCGQCLGPQSVLPYILFSSYSPLALSSIPPPRSRDGAFLHQREDSSWCEAFEDLLLASQGRPMGLHKYLPLQLRASTRPIAVDKSPHSELMKASSGFLWIRGLHDYGLLTREPPRSLPFELQHFGSPIRMKFPELHVDWKESGFVKSTLRSFPETERDAYDALEDDEYDDIEEGWDDESLEEQVALKRLVGHPTSEPEKVLHLLKAMREEVDKHFGDERSLMSEPKNKMELIKAMTEEVNKRLIREWECEDEEEWESILGERSVSSDRNCGNVVDLHKSTSTQTKPCTGQVSEADTTETAGNGWVEEAQLESRISPASDRVVSTTTSTEQTTDETGGVHTTVRIEKVYADGRRSITETSKTQISPMDMGRMQRVSDDESEETPVERRQREEEEAKNEKDKKRKGWFWN